MSTTNGEVAHKDQTHQMPDASMDSWESKLDDVFDIVEKQAGLKQTQAWSKVSERLVSDHVQVQFTDTVTKTSQSRSLFGRDAFCLQYYRLMKDGLVYCDESIAFARERHSEF
jgi:hypothetical protein